METEVDGCAALTKRLALESMLQLSFLTARAAVQPCCRMLRPAASSCNGPAVERMAPAPFFFARRWCCWEECLQVNSEGTGVRYTCPPAGGEQQCASGRAVGGGQLGGRAGPSTAADVGADSTKRLQCSGDPSGDLDCQLSIGPWHRTRDQMLPAPADSLGNLAAHFSA